MTTDIRDLVAQLTERMGGAPPHEAEQLLVHVMGCRRVDMLLGTALPTDEQWELALSLARRRAQGEPLQYLIGSVPFLSARILVGPGVLVPRPETEYLAHTALSEWRAMGSPLPHTAIDVCCGSGCIALGLALAEPELRVLGLEISDAALSWARRSLLANGAGARTELYRSDLFSALPEMNFPEHGASLIVSNPPYVAPSERDSLPRDVAEHEPGIALFSGPTGFEHVRRVVEEAPRWLARPGLLALEIGETQADNARAALEGTGAYTSWEVRPDLAGKPRMVLARRA